MDRSAAGIRQDFIDFFEERGHVFKKSSPVVPYEDPTLLFTNAGMNQFKSIFLGDNPEGLKRAVNSQKCMRVSGKHNDLEEVGVDHHHHTFFEMLGNWSFGDYYKEEAVKFAWELLTEVWDLPKDRLYATVYEEDEEAESVWNRVTDIDPERISRFGKEENFWEMGDTGPCGPCSEIHLDTGKGNCIHEDSKGHTCGVNAKGCGRYIEIWNLVFIQFNRSADNILTELPEKHVDTGMGFERIVRVLQNRDSNYDTDLFYPVIEELVSMTGREYDRGELGIPFRVIADHVRALTVALTDGALPSNEGRGYVLRRILRRACRFGRELGFRESFLYKLIPVVAEMLKEAFPELKKREAHVQNVVRSEEERFLDTLDTGIELFNRIAEDTGKHGVIPGSEVFKLYDTYGFPMDLTRLMAAEKGLKVDEQGFSEAMQRQKEMSRDARKTSDEESLYTPEGWIELNQESGTEFTGYEKLVDSFSVVKYKIAEGSQDSIRKALLVLNRTPFYVESGGQVPDKGWIFTDFGCEIGRIERVVKYNDLTVHEFVSEEGVDAEVFAGNLKGEIDVNRRNLIRKNHSATHLLHAALRSVLGDHVEQSGSRVAPEGLRFDFTHFSSLSKEELDRAEEFVNQWIMDNYDVSTKVEETEKAREEGARALFGEKYGDHVRVVKMGGISQELCGGTHVYRTGDIGSFHITAETSIASGVRRIEAVTGPFVLERLKGLEALVSDLSNSLKVPEEHLREKLESIND
ncbi:MAG: alanine--tRNA ligase, partial [Chitinivibrionales bacterium]